MDDTDGCLIDDRRERDLYDEFSYPNIGRELGELVEKKQQAYGDSFGKSHRIMMELFPNGIKPEQYHTVLTMVRVIDKLFRIATNDDPFGESPWRDIGGYSMLAYRRDLEEKVKNGS